MKSKDGSFKNINKINKFLSILMKKNREEQIMRIRNERRGCH